MADRKAELERKKAKLAQMREEKKRKEDRKKKEDTEQATKQSGKTAVHTDADELLKDLGIPLSASSSASAGSSPQKATDKVESVQSSAARSSPRVSKKLQMTQVTQTNIPPRELVTYTKETQTPHETAERDDDDADSVDVPVSTPPSHLHKMPQVEMVQPHATPEDQVKKEEPVVREISEEEKQQVMMSEDFKRFFERTSRVMERAITEQDKGIFIDYVGASKDAESNGQPGERLKISRDFFDERWSKHRNVTCLDWSTQFPELLVASYGTNEESPHEPDGVALVWNAKFKTTTPEYIFHCQSAVMSTCFAKFHPNLIIGGTYSGQIVLWDNRSNRRTPVQRTPLSSASHTHPVYCVNVVGTQNAHNLISVSTDGKMCSWSLDIFSQPQDSMELQEKHAKSVAVTSFSFLSGDVNNFVGGSEDCSVFTACRHGSKAGIGEIYEGHQGPITGIDCHTTVGQIDFSSYFLTSSMDWTIKLWSIKEQKPLYSFEDNNDYVLDVKWSPVHPAVFASTDCMGRLDLWNLNNDTEVPTASLHVDPNVALNKCKWHSNGHLIAAGDDQGRIYMCDVGESIANPRLDEWSKFAYTLQEIRTNMAENEDTSADPIR